MRRTMGRRTARPRLTRRPPPLGLPRRRRSLGRVRRTPHHRPHPGRQTAPAPVRIDPLAGLHLARTLADLGRALGTEIAPLGEEGQSQALLAIDADGRVYSIDHTGDWYLGKDIDQGLGTLVNGLQPIRLGAG